jgi:cytochrome b involved in lipid metabolism
MSKQYTYRDVAEHNTKKDMFMVIHDKVYDGSKFVDEHPGGEEVMLDVAGQDATEAFEDVGHSDEARETLEKLLVGTLKRLPGDPEPAKPTYNPKSTANGEKSDSQGLSLSAYGIIILGGILAYVGYQYTQNREA